MGKPTGFKEYPRKAVPYRPPAERLGDFLEIYSEPEEQLLRTQGARCMDCGVPFCMSATGCPIDNLIPEWNDLVYQGRWREALDRLHKTNNFPEFTGRTCPAPCEGACVLGINEPPVTIKNIENAIIDRGFAEGWITPQPPAQRTGKTVAIVGSGPAGLAAAAQLNKAGHTVTVFERADRIGGLLMYGIPNMKLEKTVVERRVQLLRDEGVRFVTRTHIGPREEFPRGHMTQIMEEGGSAVRYVDAAAAPRRIRRPAVGHRSRSPPRPADSRQATGGNPLRHGFPHPQHEKPAGFPLGGRPLYFRQVAERDRDRRRGYGGRLYRHLAATRLHAGHQFRAAGPCPAEPRSRTIPGRCGRGSSASTIRTTNAAPQSGEDPRVFSILTKEFLDNGQGHVAGVRTVRIDWSKPSDSAPFREIAGTETVWPADLILLSLGFLGPESTVAEQLGVTCDTRCNYAAPYGRFATNAAGVFAAGDCRRGQSLVVWAINEGRGAARAIDEFLMGHSTLPAPGIGSTGKTWR